MRRNLSITTAVATLVLGTAFAAAQGVQRQAPGGAAPELGTQSQGQVTPQEGRGQGKAQQQPRTQGQSGQGQSQVAPQEGQGKGKAQSKEPRNQGQDRQAQPQQNQRNDQQQQQQGQAPRDNQKGAESKGGAQSGGATLTTEQRTTIRQTVLQGGNAPRVSSVNFSINVGVVVPRTVRAVAVPAPLIEIHPAWRGHLYFIVGERIIIIEPASHKIVAVLVV